MIKLSEVQSLSQELCAWDTRLVSDAPGHLDESRNEGRREKEEIMHDLSPCMGKR